VLGSPDVIAPRDLALLGPLRHRPEETAVLCDLDGTLAPIVARPEDARLLPAARPALRAVRDRVGLVAFISGRAIADLARIVDLDGCAYAGNHGMELQRVGGVAGVAPQVAPHLDAIVAFASSWPAGRLAPHGVWLEEKGPTLSFHYRTAPQPGAAAAFLEGTVAPAARAAGLVTTPGRMVIEVRPPVAVDKGTAARALLDGTGLRLAVALGDDRTDVDTWRTLRQMVTEGALERAVAVGVVGPEAPEEVRRGADLRVPDPAGAVQVLLAIAGR
jgi:trehalose 6-phosphate phosphatase